MPGIVQRKYIGELIRFNKTLIKPLNSVKTVLPYDYSEHDIFVLFKELFPYEWEIIEQRYKHYKAKDTFLIKVGKKIRYKPVPPRFYLSRLQKVKHMLSDGQKKLHRQNFNEENRLERLLMLRGTAKNRTAKIRKKIDCNKSFMQDIEPLYIDIFIQAYHKKGIDVDGKMEIVRELQKYDCEKSNDFFYKLNDSERNSQIRVTAFKHLQAMGKYVKLRKGFKGKKKSYMLEKTSFNMKPIDLMERIDGDSIQNKKTFDYFISHSYIDNELVRKIKKELNELKLHVYCDWLNDTDFLKREYSSEYTKAILKKRIEQSKKVLFIRTKNTNNIENNFLSEWVKMEIMHAKESNKDIECVDFIGDGKCEFSKCLSLEDYLKRRNHGGH